MCDPVSMTVASAGLQAGGQVFGFMQQKANAKATNKWQEQIHSLNTEQATKSGLAAYAALAQRRQEERAKAAQAINEVARDAVMARGAARVAAGEAGVGGGSVDALLSDFSRQELEYQSSVLHGQRLNEAQFEREGEAIQSQTYGRIVSTLAVPAQKPNLFGLLLGIGGSALQGFDDATSYNKQSKSFEFD